MGKLGMREGKCNPKVLQLVAGQGLALGSSDIESGVLSGPLRDELGPRK